MRFIRLHTRKTCQTNTDNKNNFTKRKFDSCVVSAVQVHIICNSNDALSHSVKVENNMARTYSLSTFRFTTLVITLTYKW